MKHEKYPYTKERTFFLLLQISQLTNKIKDGICQTAPVKTSVALTTEPKCKHLKSLACHTIGSFYYQDCLWEILRIYCCGKSMVTEQYVTEI